MKKILSAAIVFFSLLQTITPQDKFSLQLNAGPLFLTETEAAETGLSISASLLYQISEKFDLSLRTGYLNWTQKDSRFGLRTEHSGIPFLAGARYYFSKQDLQPFVSLEGGISYSKSQVNNRIFIGEDSWYARTDNITSTGITFGFGAGLRYALNENLNLDLSAGIQHPESSYEYVQLSAGIGVRM